MSTYISRHGETAHKTKNCFVSLLLIYINPINPDVLYIGHPVYLNFKSTNYEYAMAIYITKRSFWTTFHEHMVFILYGSEKNKVLVLLHFSLTVMSCRRRVLALT